MLAERKVVTKIEANPLLTAREKERSLVRVAAYCRVSTDSDEQLDSYQAQITYYTDYIAKNPDWRFAGIYADEGITGTKAEKRPEFQRLMRDCKKRKIDMILTKSVARFARNTVDSLSYVRRLKAQGIGGQRDVYRHSQRIGSGGKRKYQRQCAVGNPAENEIRYVQIPIQYSRLQKRRRW